VLLHHRDCAHGFGPDLQACRKQVSALMSAHAVVCYHCHLTSKLEPRRYIGPEDTHEQCVSDCPREACSFRAPRGYTSDLASRDTSAGNEISLSLLVQVRPLAASTHPLGRWRSFAGKDLLCITLSLSVLPRPFWISCLSSLYRSHEGELKFRFFWRS
jgi:hypothetical protein